MHVEVKFFELLAVHPNLTHFGFLLDFPTAPPQARVPPPQLREVET